MNKNIINIAVKKFQELYKKYNGFINVGVDNWRGWRFVFDTEDVRKCKNNCKSCPLYFLLKNERITDFSAGLYPASKEDKELFGPQNFLNCKTNCFRLLHCVRNDGHCPFGNVENIFFESCEISAVE